jgi:hypothetical protein
MGDKIILNNLFKINNKLIMDDKILPLHLEIVSKKFVFLMYKNKNGLF